MTKSFCYSFYHCLKLNVLLVTKSQSIITDYYEQIFLESISSHPQLLEVSFQTPKLWSGFLLFIERNQDFCTDLVANIVACRMWSKVKTAKLKIQSFKGSNWQNQDSIQVYWPSNPSIERKKGRERNKKASKSRKKDKSRLVCLITQSYWAALDSFLLCKRHFMYTHIIIYT